MPKRVSSKTGSELFIVDNSDGWHPARRRDGPEDRRSGPSDRSSRPDRLAALRRVHRVDYRRAVGDHRKGPLHARHSAALRNCPAETCRNRSQDRKAHQELSLEALERNHGCQAGAQGMDGIELTWPKPRSRQFSHPWCDNCVPIAAKASRNTNVPEFTNLKCQTGISISSDSRLVQACPIMASAGTRNGSMIS